MKCFDTSDFEVEFENSVLPFLLHSRAQELGDKTFYMFEDQRVTYRELNSKVNRVANSFVDLGIKKGDKVCFMMKNSIEFVYSWFALAKIGAIMVPMNPTLRGNLLQYIMSNSDATLAIVDNDLASRIQFIEDEISKVNKIIVVKENSEFNEDIAFKHAKVLEFENLFTGSDNSPNIKVNPWDIMTILYTSGTTGPSKGAMISHHYYYDNALACTSWMRHSRNDVLYTCLPFFHANASITSIYAAMLAKATVAIGKKFSLKSFWREISMYGATHTNVMGSILVLLMKQEPSQDEVNNTLKVVNSVPLIPESAEFEKRFGVKLITMFGATETSIVTASPFDEETKPDSCGKALPQYDVRIFDDYDRECPPGVVGEIVVRGKRPFIQMEGYYNMPENTLRSFRNLWYHTGDYGTVDEDGYLYFVDRKKDSIRRRGENISSFEVEEVVNSHPAVMESAAVAVKDKEMTEDEVMIYVILKEGQSLAPIELIDFCKDRMAYFMVPRYVEFIKEFPKTPNQKIEKYKLRERGLTPETWDREKAGIKVSR